MLDNTLGAIEATNRFRDPIYGYVWVTDDELQIIDTPIFQRLRRIQQLALTKYVYPTAEHSRFVHSLGVLQSATNIFAELMRRRRNREIILDIIGESELPTYLKTLRFSALLHDVGHLPFSHAGEEVFLPRGLRHEHVGHYIIRNAPGLRDILEENGVQPEIVASILVNKPRAKYGVISRILSGVFDADRADYLLRDSHNCGVAYGHYDYIRYVSSFALSELDGRDFSLTIEEGSIHALEAFLLARFNYNMQVPYHRTRVGYDCALSKYLKNLRTQERLPDLGIKQDTNYALTQIDLGQFTVLDDLDIVQQAKSDSREGDTWARMVMREDHLTPVYDRVETTQEDRVNYREYVMMLRDDALVEGEDFIRYSEEVRVHDLITGSEERLESADRIKVVDKGGETIGDFLECSQVVQTLQEKSVRLLRVYATPQKREAALKTRDALTKRIRTRNQID